MKIIKISILLIFLQVALFSKAHAFCFCKEPDKPSFLSQSTWGEYQMKAKKKAVEEYLYKTEEYKSCLYQCISSATYNAESVTDQWNKAVESYNKHLIRW